MKRAKFMLAGTFAVAIIGGLFAFKAKNPTIYYRFDSLTTISSLKCTTTAGFTTTTVGADSPTPTTLYLSKSINGTTCLTPTTVYPQAD